MWSCEMVWDIRGGEKPVTWHSGARGTFCSGPCCPETTITQHIGFTGAFSANIALAVNLFTSSPTVWKLTELAGFSQHYRTKHLEENYRRKKRLIKLWQEKHIWYWGLNSKAQSPSTLCIYFVMGVISFLGIWIMIPIGVLPDFFIPSQNVQYLQTMWPYSTSVSLPLFFFSPK